MDAPRCAEQLQNQLHRSEPPSVHNNLYYDDDSLLNWCLIDGPDPSPDEPLPNTNGILYGKWAFAQGEDRSNISRQDQPEIFDRSINSNAYKYPGICEPWRIKLKSDEVLLIQMM